ncbi:MAG: stage IV sporulation protein A [Clostridia bacterium]|nr:stage IV sporulation protein A [Clostridia bacterium]
MVDHQKIYEDIATRTGGDIYIGVVGPVRTGKSTFIKKFIETMILDGIEDPNAKTRAVDEMPISGAGRTIMTTQPRFIPNEAVSVAIGDARADVRLIDCVGYLIDGVLGLHEGDDSRMVRTPWFDHDIPFEKAAETGTRKVIAEHSTLGVVVTTDGTITDIPRQAYVSAENRVVNELKALGKPFIIILNSAEPENEQATILKNALEEKYSAPVMAMDVTGMTRDDAGEIMKRLLYEFPLTEARVYFPEWVLALDEDHWLRQSLMKTAGEAASNMKKVSDHGQLARFFGDNENCVAANPMSVRLNDGGCDYELRLADGLFYRILTEASGQVVEGEEHLMKLMTEMTKAKNAYDRVCDALKSAEATGYGLVSPSMSEIELSPPEVVKQGGKFGVKLKAAAPSLHIIRVDIEGEVNPLVGTQKQSEELMDYLAGEFESDPESIWQTNIFGKPLSDLMKEELSGKLNRLPEDVRQKLRGAMTKIINEGNGGIICILL